MLYSILYVSSMVGDNDVQDLLATFRKSNENHEISGLMLHYDKNIMQYIEGEKSRVEQLYKNIKKDQRHSGIIKIIGEVIETRKFHGWDMLFDESHKTQEFLENIEKKPNEEVFILFKTFLKTFIKTVILDNFPRQKCTTVS